MTRPKDDEPGCRVPEAGTGLGESEAPGADLSPPDASPPDPATSGGDTSAPPGADLPARDTAPTDPAKGGPRTEDLPGSRHTDTGPTGITPRDETAPSADLSDPDSPPSDATSMADAGAPGLRDDPTPATVVAPALTEAATATATATADRTVIGSAPGVQPGTRPADATLHGDGMAEAVAKLLDAGTLINNNYRITGLVSSGGMGEVYRAENVFTGDPVAVKVILPGLANDQAVLDLFRREARVLVQLRDDTIVRYHNFVLDSGLQRYCLIMEFVEGRHLGARIKEDGALPETAVLALMRRLAGGLARAHADGVTHRDLSPDNVILRNDRIDEPVLIDFGIARSTELGDGLAGRFAGKFKYIAPEQLGHWQGEIGPWTDVYGLALLMSAVSRGSALPMGDSVVSASAARQTIPDLGGISHRLFPLLQHMLEPDPARRPRDMGTVLRLLDDPMALPAQYRLPLWSAEATRGLPEASDVAQEPLTQSHSPFAGLAASPPPSAPPAAARSRRWGTVLTFSVLAAVATAAGLWVMSPARSTDPPPPAAISHPPAVMQARDPNTREGFLADQPLPPCSFVTRIAHGPGSGRLLALSDRQLDLTGVIDAYQTRFGAAPSVLTQRIGTDQCAALQFLREIAGRPVPPPLLEATSRITAGGFQIRGQVRTGADDRSLWLFLLSPTGRVYDLTGQVARDADGRFAVEIGLPDTEAPAAAYLLVGLVVEQPLVSVTAAPSGAEAAELLPHVLAELNATSAAPSASLVVLSAGAEASD